MYYTIVFLIITLLIPSAGFSQNHNSEDQPNPKRCAKSQITIIGQNRGENFRFKLGDTLKIEVSGGCMEKVKAAFDKYSTSDALRLYLDDVKMEGLSIIPSSQNETAKKMTLAIHLTRNSYVAKNQKAWNELLAKQHDLSVMSVPVGLSIKNEIPWEVLSPHPFELYIVETKQVWVTSIICLIIFLTSYYLLIKNPTALRDRGSAGYSLGKSQMAFWGLLLILAFASIWFLTGTMERIPEQILVLLGISGATGLSSILIGENKKAIINSELQTALVALRDNYQLLKKSKLKDPDKFSQESEKRLLEITMKIADLSEQRSTPKSKGFWQDICDDGNGLSFHRLQVVLWTVMLGAVFIRSIAQTISIPEFPENLLLLLGISNGIYLGFKFPEKAGGS